jgi:pyridoxamine 5'-phosphate oxidase
MIDKERLQNIRRQYIKEKLSTKIVNEDPFKQFEKWFSESLKIEFVDPSAMTLTTASKEGKPSARVVLLKGFDNRGFVFYTNYKSRKGREIEQNPLGCLLFYWDKLDRQVRIDGKIEKVTKEESEKYFATRPYKSRLGAWASNQSSVIESRSVIVKEFIRYFLKYGKNVPLPPFWGGYRLIPNEFEFWQGRPNRLHDRIRYTLHKKGLKAGWKIERLAP